MRCACLLLLVGIVGGCDGGGQGMPPLTVTLFNFAPGFGGVHLNSPLELTFSAPVSEESVNADSIRIFTTTWVGEVAPGAPAIGDYVVSANVVRFLPRIPQVGDISDTGLRMGVTYTIQVPASPDVIDPVRSTEGDPNLVPYSEFFTTLNPTILPAPGDILAEPNLGHLQRFFVDEGIENGFSPCPREDLAPADRDSPQVIDTDPDEGESGFGTITGIEGGLGTAFVRLDPITVEFSEPISPWRIRPQNIVITNQNLGGETFDLFFFFRQDRSLSRLQITVFDADSAFDQASVPQGRYVLALSQFTDLAGNPLIDSSEACRATGEFKLSFSTVSSPALPTDLTYTFGDDDQDGHTDVGGLKTALNDPNLFPDHIPPFLGGVSVNQEGIATPSPSTQTTTANWGNIGYWTGYEVRFDNYYDPFGPGYDAAKFAGLRLRGGAMGAATPLLAPLAGRGMGRSSPSGSLDGSVSLPDPLLGKIDFSLVGDDIARLFTGDDTTGPIVYHYRRFELLENAGDRPLLTASDDSEYPLLIFVEEEATITGDLILDGGNGEFGFDGEDGVASSTGRNPGGRGGNGIAGGGDGGLGGAGVIDLQPGSSLSGDDGSVPWNVFGPVDALSKSVAGIDNMATGGGGRWDPDTATAYQGGGGGAAHSKGQDGSDLDDTTPGVSDQGVGGQQFGTGIDFSEPSILATGGAGGGGGAAEDDNNIGDPDPDDSVTEEDNGGGGGGGGGGYLSFTCAGDIHIGSVDDNDTPEDVTDDIVTFAIIRCVGGRGGSTYAEATGNPPVPGPDAGDPDPSSAMGLGDAGGGGGGGGMSIVSGGQLEMIAAEIYVYGKRGGNSEDIEGGIGRDATTEGGAGGAGVMVFADEDGFTADEISVHVPGGGNLLVQLVPDPNRDINPPDNEADLDPVDDADIIRDMQEMAGSAYVNYDIYGDDPREVLFNVTQIVTEFFDTLSDSVSYDQVRILSNAPRYAYEVDSSNPPESLKSPPTVATIRYFVDTTNAGGGGLPDLSAEDPQSGDLGGTNSFTFEVGSHFNAKPPEEEGDPPIGAALSEAQYESTYIVPANSLSLKKRYVRLRIRFDLLLGNATPETLLATFDPPGGADEVISEDNVLGNVETAPQGVPAVAEIRIKFTP